MTEVAATLSSTGLSRKEGAAAAAATSQEAWADMTELGRGGYHAVADGPCRNEGSAAAATISKGVWADMKELG